jgi:hypothetical protein
MKLFRRTRAESQAPRTSVVEGLERLLRRARLVTLVAPLLLLMGGSLGKLATSALELPEDKPVRIVPDTPRIEIEKLGRFMEELRSNGEQTVNYVVLYRDHVGPVEDALRKRGVPRATARKVAWPLVEHAYKQGLDPATVVSVLLIESQGKPTATSPVGARGLMQVMPLWAGKWRGCGRNLYDIEDNLCHGTSILAWYIQRNGGDERRALLGYNGCVRGTNTPNCHTYPDKVQRLRAQIRADMERSRLGAFAASP